MVWLLILFVIIGLVAVFSYIKKKQIELEESFQKRFAGKTIRCMDKYALFIAQQSDGYSHFRGTGYLVLTDQELYYERQFGHKVISIPLASIVDVGETLRLGGQSTGRSMLKVAFKDQKGQEDAVAWRVKQLHRWQDEISALIAKKV